MPGRLPATIVHLRSTFGTDLVQWSWGRTHTLTHNHPPVQQKSLDKLFSVGPFGVPGGRELPNALGTSIGPAPWAVTYGPSTRRVIDFAYATRSLGINPLGQSGVAAYTDISTRAEPLIQGREFPPAPTKSPYNAPMLHCNINPGRGSCSPVHTH